MPFHTALRSLFGASFSALVIAAAIGCNPIVSVGGGAGDDAGGHAGTGGKVGGAGGEVGGTGGVGGGTDVPPGTGGGVAAKVYDSVAYQLASNGGGGFNGGGGVGGVGGGGNPDGPTGEYLVYGTGVGAPTCDSVFGTEVCGGWTVVLHLDDESLLTPGTLNIGDPGLDIFFSESTAEGPNSCSGGGGGGFKGGTLEILDVTPDQVHFRVSGISLLDFDSSGEFTADRCAVQD